MKSAKPASTVTQWEIELGEYDGNNSDRHFLIRQKPGIECKLIERHDGKRFEYTYDIRYKDGFNGWVRYAYGFSKRQAWARARERWEAEHGNS